MELTVCQPIVATWPSRKERLLVAREPAACQVSLRGRSSTISAHTARKIRGVKMTRSSYAAISFGDLITEAHAGSSMPLDQIFLAGPSCSTKTKSEFSSFYDNLLI
jgi:hypothetical protein